MSKKGSASLLDGDFSLTDRRVSHHAMARARERGVPVWKLGSRGALGDGEAVVSSSGRTVVTVIPDRFKRAATGARAARKSTQKKNREGALTRRCRRKILRQRLLNTKGISFIAELAIPKKFCGAWIGPGGKFIIALKQSGKAAGVDVHLATDDLGGGEKSDGVLFLTAKSERQIRKFVAGVDDLPREVSFDGLDVRKIIREPPKRNKRGPVKTKKKKKKS